MKRIENVAWSVCDALRGIIDPGSYRHYVLGILFLKYISDKRNHRFNVPDRASFDFLYNNRNAANIAKLLKFSLESIAKSNSLGDIFNLDFNIAPSLFCFILEQFNTLDLSCVSEDIMGNTYIYLLERFACDAGKKAGEFYTPKQISKLIIKLCDPKSGSSLCDPTCGSGGLLLEAASSGVKELYGMELNKLTWSLCKINMLLHNLDSARIECCDTLLNPKLKYNKCIMQFDNVVANPPFSAIWQRERLLKDARFKWGIPTKAKADYAFISHMIISARQKVVVVVPHGVLFRAGVEKGIRKNIINQNLLDAVIGLPRNLFPTTSIPVAILIFDKNKQNEDIIFIDASADFIANNYKGKNSISDAAIERIYQTYSNRVSVNNYSYIANIESIVDNDFNLNIIRYIDKYKPDDIDLPTLDSEIEDLERQLADVQDKISEFDIDKLTRLC